MYAERDGPVTALMQHDHCVSDRDEGGYQHEPTKGMCGPVSHKNRGEQSRCNVTNTFSGQIRSRMRFDASRYAISRRCRLRVRDAIDISMGELTEYIGATVLRCTSQLLDFSDLVRCPS